MLSKHEKRLQEVNWWKKIGYRSKQAEFALYFLCISGILMWDIFEFSWDIVRFSLFAHFIGALFLGLVFLVPFWLSHRSTYKKSTKTALRITGKVVDYLLSFCFIAGIYLFFIGDRGNMLGNLSFWIHLLIAIPITGLVIYHSLRYSMLRKIRWVVALLGAFISLFIGAQAFASSSSSSFILSDNYFYSANFDTGTVSKINKQTGTLERERTLGEDIRRIAMSADKTLLLVSDFTAHKLYLLDAITLDTLKTITTPKRPFGIVYDATNKLFWVTAFEAHQLLGIDHNGTIQQHINTLDTPRGIALTDDGRLLLTHAMIGKISLYNTQTLPLKKAKIITLHETQNNDEFISQGVPRQLDDIAISPDGSQAWLPHLLWNFDHPFQFQSTLFPAVSIISLEKNNEHELTDLRKHLFKQINILENGTKTRIVSNPHDAEFSANGTKLYVTLSASEDLMVFDLSRSSKGKTRSNRRKGKKHQGGAKVNQIFRHLPGDNPRGLIIDGDDIFVQNAMSLDMSQLKTGGNNAFAQVKLKHAHFATLVKEDPLSQNLRQGKRLFYSANRDDFPDTPMAGDYWMSCASCHSDGFNFTNSYLFKDTPVNKMQNAIIGHATLSKMVAGDFVGDYLRIIRDTQGGMGADSKHDTVQTAPEGPSPKAKKMMEDLHQFVTEKNNLPYLSTWLRLSGSIPEPKQWVNSAQCASCHSDIFEQWTDSNHHYMADSNPYYRVVEDYAASIEGEKFRQWCMGCHNPKAVISGETKTDGPLRMLEQKGHSLFEALQTKRPFMDEGTGCISCHRITELENAHSPTSGGNASFTIDIENRKTYIGEENMGDLQRWFAELQINSKPKTHAESYSKNFYKSSRYCATCHNEFSPGTGAVVVNTYGEWEKSPFNNPSMPAKHKECISCHMHADISKIGQDIPGISTDGGRLKNNVVTHQFTGANHHLVGLRNKKLSDMSIALLESSAELEILPPLNNRLTIRVKNVGAGHHLPTGVADFRQFWLHVTVQDKTGAILFENGNVKNGVVPQNARMFRKIFADKNDKPVGLAFWKMAKIIEDTRIPAGEFRDETFNLPHNLPKSVDIEAKLLFRIFPKWVNDTVRKSYPDLPDPPILELEKVQLQHSN